MLVPDDLRGRVMMAVVDSDDVACPCVLQAVGIRIRCGKGGGGDAWYYVLDVDGQMADARLLGTDSDGQDHKY